MKIHRFRRQGLTTSIVKPIREFHTHVLTTRMALIALTLTTVCSVLNADPTVPTSGSPTSGSSSPASKSMESRGDSVLGQVLNRLTQGAAFNAKLRERVWTSGREAVGIGTYEQAGGSTGNYNLQVTMHDGVGGQHTLQQISDGRLAWTRTDIAEGVLLRRVDIRILEQRVREAGVTSQLPPRVLVGGLAELIDSIRRDYDLRLKPGAFQLKTNLPQASTVRLDGATSVGSLNDAEKFLVVEGSLKAAIREQIQLKSGRTDWPSLCPARVQVLVTTQPNPETQFGEGLPRRVYFFSDPIPQDEEQQPDDAAKLASPTANTVAGNASSTEVGPLISLIELYSVQPIAPPAKERFTFDSRDDDNNYINETERYLARYGL